jgi:hypothetical protein
VSSREKVMRHTAHITSRGPLSGGQFSVSDDRVRGGQPFIVEDELHLAAYIHQHSSEPDFYPLGDLVHGTLQKLGIKKPCLPCAHRQAKLNRLLKRR